MTCRALTFLLGATVAGCSFFNAEEDGCSGSDCSAGEGGAEPGDGDGGDDDPVEGGAPTGGDSGDGGTGGTAASGTGGGAAGGAGGATDSAAWVAELSRDLVINELYFAYVEIYFAANVAESLSLDGMAIIVDEDYGAPCLLDGGSVSKAERYFVAQEPEMGWYPNVTNYVYDCPIDIREDSRVDLVVDVAGEWAIIDTAYLDTDLIASWSYQARPDGSADFTKRDPTPGASND